MHGPKPTPIELSDAERQGLEKLVKRHQTLNRLPCELELF